MKFSKEIHDALDVMGYKELLPVQQEVIPHLMEGHDIIVKSRTGSGKTAAFAIPLCEKINWDDRNLQVLVIACTRELALQSEKEFKQIGRFKKIRCLSLIGKKNMDYQKQLLHQGYHVVVATPGRLLDHIEQGNLDLSTLRYVVIDEADALLEYGFMQQMERLISYFPDDCVTALFSATYPERIQKLCEHFMRDPVMITMDQQAAITHYFVSCESKWKALLDVLGSIQAESVIVFCAMQNTVDELYQRLSKMQIPALKLHGGMHQKKRIEQMERFKKGEVRLLVATDVAGRGIDIEKVTHIIHYDIPTSLKAYTHRCGRSARLEKLGASIILKDAKETLHHLEEEYSFSVFEVSSSRDLSYLHTSVVKQDKQEKWEAYVEVLHLNVGKEKKIRIGDIVGALCSIENITMEDIGVVEVLNNMSYVEILNGKADIVLHALEKMTIKQKRVKAQRAKR